MLSVFAWLFIFVVLILNTPVLDLVWQIVPVCCCVSPFILCFSVVLFKYCLSFIYFVQSNTTGLSPNAIERLP